MKLVKDALLKLRSAPVGIGPLERRQVDDFGWAMNTLWLKPRCGIWIFMCIVKLIDVSRMRLDIAYQNLMVAAVILGHGEGTIGRADKMYCNFLSARGPH